MSRPEATVRIWRWWLAAGLGSLAWAYVLSNWLFYVFGVSACCMAFRDLVATRRSRRKKRDVAS